LDRSYLTGPTIDDVLDRMMKILELIDLYSNPYYIRKKRATQKGYMKPKIQKLLSNESTIINKALQ
jgi:hypothetical protein